MVRDAFPPAILLGAGLLLATTLGGVGFIQYQKLNGPPVAVDLARGATVVERKVLRFVDLGDGTGRFQGGVRVYDASTSQELKPLAANEGFIRAILNGLAFERLKMANTATPELELTAWSDNRLTLSDPVTGRTINLGDFGPDNKKTFIRFLTADGGAQ